MKTSQFEGCKVAMKQDKTGYVLTLSIHPNDVPDEILRDFVGARYQVVMVRLNGEEQPMARESEFGGAEAVRLAGIICREPEFHKYLQDRGEIFEANEQEATEWLRSELHIQSRSELKNKPESVQKFIQINEDYKTWKNA